MSGEIIVRYTRSELKDLVKREGSLTDWARIEAMTDEENEANIASDPDSQWPDLPEGDFGNCMVSLPADDFVGLDQRILDFFRAQGPDFRDRIRAVLLDHIEQTERSEAAD